MLLNFTSLFLHNLSLGGLGWITLLDTLDAGEASSLELPFEEREVLEVVKGLNRDKAPGPDGFTLAFFQDCWDVIKFDLMGVF
jgi:hypothetical protein